MVHRTHRITITNFCLGKHLVSEGDLLKDQRGSPAYISPDVLSGTVRLCQTASPGCTRPVRALGSNLAFTGGPSQIFGLEKGEEILVTEWIRLRNKRDRDRISGRVLKDFPAVLACWLCTALCCAARC